MSERIFNLLLRFSPRRFRDEYGAASPAIAGAVYRLISVPIVLGIRGMLGFKQHSRAFAISIDAAALPS